MPDVPAPEDAAPEGVLPPPVEPLYDVLCAASLRGVFLHGLQKLRIASSSASAMAIVFRLRILRKLIKVGESSQAAVPAR